ncbi:Uncharacterised protein [uncultured archaeon]|nr:Uncharacterised protein [uncultured archaeon]
MTKTIIVGNEFERMNLAKRILELSGDESGIVLQEPQDATSISLPEYLQINSEDNYIK